MQGREIDMDKLMRQNELMPAIGNMKVNARGDELGPGGQIVRKREDIVAEYYDTNPAANIKKAQPKTVQSTEPVSTPTPAPVIKSADDAPDIVPVKKSKTVEE
jgi:hypothetical protein